MKKGWETLGRFWKRNGSLCAAAACVALVAVVFAVSMVRNTGELPEPTATPRAELRYEAARQAQTRPAVTLLPTLEPTVCPTASPAAAPVAAPAVQPWVWPVKGEIQAPFADQSLLYRPTLGQWMVHPALDIRAQPGTEVVAALQGRVETVREDKLLGKTVILRHEEGYRSLYCGLETVTVTMGNTLRAGEPLGTVGNGALSETEQGPHLHFALEKDRKPVDPMTLLSPLP